jgi:hypothetical protein
MPRHAAAQQGKVCTAKMHCAGQQALAERMCLGSAGVMLGRWQDISVIKALRFLTDEVHCEMQSCLLGVSLCRAGQRKL